MEGLCIDTHTAWSVSRNKKYNYRAHPRVGLVTTLFPLSNFDFEIFQSLQKLGNIVFFITKRESRARLEFFYRLPTSETT